MCPSPASAGEGGAQRRVRVWGLGPDHHREQARSHGLRSMPQSGPEGPFHKTPPPAAGRAGSPVGAALAATPRLQSADFDPGRCRGQKTPPTKPRLRPQVGQDPLWERPWPRRGGCSPPTSIQAAVGVRRPLPQNPGSGLRSGAIPVGAALAATGPPHSSGFDAGCRRGQDPSHKTPAPTTDRAGSRWEQPWPRRDRCRPPAPL